MPSSTSNSSRRAPLLKYGREWGAILVCLGMLFIGSEWYYRSHGYWPTVTDSQRLWAFHRDDVYERNGQRRIVIAGSSRAQLGLVPEALESVLPRFRAKQLAVDGTPAYHIVRDLCLDPNFNGVILWSTVPRMMFPDADLPVPSDEQYPQFYHEKFAGLSAVNENLNSLVGAMLQDRFVCLAPGLTFRTLKSLLQLQRPAPPHVSMRFDRYRPGRYRALMSRAQRRQKRRRRLNRRRIFQVPIERNWFKAQLAIELRSLSTALRSRGGSLILLRMPTTGKHWQLDQELTPRHAYWDVIEETAQVSTIHFNDYPNLRSISCPDGSHIDWTDAHSFTRAVALILREILPPVRVETQNSAPHPRAAVNTAPPQAPLTSPTSAVKKVWLWMPFCCVLLR